MENQPIKLNKAVKVSIMAGALILALTTAYVVLDSGKNKNNQLNNIQSKLDQQEANITELEIIKAEQQARIDEQQAKLDKLQDDKSEQEQQSQTQANNALKKQADCLRVNELYVKIPDKPSGGCSTLGPNNIVDMYKEIKKSYEEYKDDKETTDGEGNNAGKCFKKYLDVLEPAYNKYLEAKKLCP